MATVCQHEPPAHPESEIQVRFGLILRKKRRCRGWSQEVLAELANLNRTYVGEIERGSVIPSIVTLEKLARALHTTPAELLADCEK